MKHLCAAALTIAAILPFSASAAQPTLITVTGQGHATAAPDIATMSLLISTNSDSATTATSDNNVRYNSLVNALSALGITKSDIRTGYYNVNYNPRPTAGTPISYPQQYGYIVTRNVNVTIHRIANAGRAVDAAISAGVNNVQGVSFGVADNHALVLRSLGDAVTQARARAQAIASAAGLHIVRLRTIQEGYSAMPAPVPMARAMVASVPTELPPSDVSAQATVTATYEATP